MTGLVCLLAVGVPRQALAQASPRELREQAFIKLGKGDFLSAIPDLQQLIVYLGDSDKSQIVASMETIYYNVGVCYFFVGQFDECQDAFKTYLKKYRNGSRVKDAELFVADSLRFTGKLEAAIKAYATCLKKHRYSGELRADIYSGMARCYLAQDDWAAATEPLVLVYKLSPDFVRQNWAATLLTTAYFKSLDLDRVYAIVPILLRPNSFAAHSIAFNMGALEAGDELFGGERYRDALWVYRMVYPYDTLLVCGEQYLEYLEKQAERTRRYARDPRALMRIQETIGELEEELKALDKVENYDLDLYSRIARGYMELMRFWEARELFVFLHFVAEAREAEEALFLAFQCSNRILPWDRAFELGEQYMETYPAGEFYDALTLAMGQMYARQENWPEVVRHLKTALEVSPKHESAAECMFLIGYASFMQEDFDQAIDYLSRLNTEFPGSDMRDQATYWLGMAFLFKGEYEDAAREFDSVLTEFPDSIYIRDAGFRRAVCEYGLGRYRPADGRLASFIEAYPDDTLTSEALMMRGDIGGALGELTNAVVFYQQAMGFEDFNIEMYNHCAFQAGRILSESERYDGLRAHFVRYLKQKREGANIPQAVYWIGVSLWNTGEQAGALRYYRDAVLKYGKDPGAIGVDMILDEWIGHIRKSPPDTAATARRELMAALARAESDEDRTLALRLRRAVWFDAGGNAHDRTRAREFMASSGSIELASPAVLQLMLDLAREDGRSEFAGAVARRIVGSFTETDYALDARMVLADMAIAKARAATDRSTVPDLYAEARMHLGVIREVYASSTEAGRALMLLGQLGVEERQFEEADECYKSVLGVRGWRNLWPEALYGRGECAFLGRRYEVASAYYERIYLMYGHYRGWAAKAYVRRAECLRKLYQNAKAREVLTEMLSDATLADLPEAETARTLLEQSGGGS